MADAGVAAFFEQLKLAEVSRFVRGTAPSPLHEQVRDGAKAIARQAAERFDAGDLRGALVALGRNNEPFALAELDDRGLVSDDQLRSVLIGTWSAAEFPCRYVPRRRWLAWFARAGFLGEPRPTAPLEVWRSQVGRTIGLAWSGRQAQAEWFHERNRGWGLVSRMLHGYAPPSSILAIVANDENRNEDEIIVSPSRRFWKEAA